MRWGNRLLRKRRKRQSRNAGNNCEVPPPHRSESLLCPLQGRTFKKDATVEMLQHWRPAVPNRASHQQKPVHAPNNQKYQIEEFALCNFGNSPRNIKALVGDHRAAARSRHRTGAIKV